MSTILSRILKLQKAVESKSKFWVQMHGSHVAGSIRLPKNVFIVYTSSPGGYGIGSLGLSLPSPLLGHVTEENTLITSLITQLHPTYSVTYTPGMLIPRMSLQFDRPDPWCGIRKAPVIRRIIGEHDSRKPTEQTNTTIIFNKRMGLVDDLPYAVRIGPDIFRKRVSFGGDRINMSLEYLIGFVSRHTRPTARNPLVLILNTCRSVCHMKNVHRLIKYNKQTPGYAGFSRPPRMLTTPKELLAWALKTKKRRTINNTAASNSQLYRAVQGRSDRNAIRHIKKSVKPGVALNHHISRVVNRVYEESSNNNNTRNRR